MGGLEQWCFGLEATVDSKVGISLVSHHSATGIDHHGSVQLSRSFLHVCTVFLPSWVCHSFGTRIFLNAT
jgi:hypothetical protein